MRNADMFKNQPQTEYERLVQEKRDALEVEQHINLLERTIEQDQKVAEAHRQVARQIEEGITENEAILQTLRSRFESLGTQDDYLQRILEEREKG